MYIYLYVCMYICMYVCMYVYVYVYGICTCICTCIYIYIYYIIVFKSSFKQNIDSSHSDTVNAHTKILLWIKILINKTNKSLSINICIFNFHFHDMLQKVNQYVKISLLLQLILLINIIFISRK